MDIIELRSFPVHAMSQNLGGGGGGGIIISRWRRPMNGEFSCKQSLHTFSPGANGFTFLTISHLMLKSVFFFCFFFYFQT